MDSFQGPSLVSDPKTLPVKFPDPDEMRQRWDDTLPVKLDSKLDSTSFSDLLAIIRQVESKNQDGAVGDLGKSRGAYQFKKSTWDWTTRVRKQQGLPTVGWKAGAHNRVWANRYAETHARVLAQILVQELGSYSDRWIYVGWNSGVNGMLEVSRKTKQVPSITRLRMHAFSDVPRKLG